MTDDAIEARPANQKKRFEKIIVPTVEIILLLGLLTVGVMFALAVLNPTPRIFKVTEFDMDSLIDIEDVRVSSKSRSFSTTTQDTKSFPDGKWSRDSHLFAWDVQVNDWIEWKVPVSEKGQYKISAYLTRALDYGIVQISMDGKKIGPTIDLWAKEYRIKPTGPIELGTFPLRPPTVTLRLQVVGRNEKNFAPHYQFGIDGFALEEISE